jgi:ribonuclease D
MKTLPAVRYIDTSAALTVVCAQLRGNPWLILDTEFLREKTYYPKLCLLQVATPDLIACIDPLALEDLTPLLDVIYDEGIMKVLHAARQDMEIFFHLRNALPAPVFDTQIAALLLGYPDQIGYGNLVKETLGIELDKLHSRTDWSRRPLSDEQIRYAAEDVFYLAQVYRHLVEKLTGLGRLDWLSEDFARLTQVELYSNDPEQAWLKVRGSNRLRGPSLAVLQALAQWRETVARDRTRAAGCCATMSWSKSPATCREHRPRSARSGACMSDSSTNTAPGYSNWSPTPGAAPRNPCPRPTILFASPRCRRRWLTR